MTRIYVDGQEGTTGLKIRQRLERRGGIELITIDADKRHDPEERARCLNAADIKSYGRIILESTSTCCCFGVAKHNANLFTELINKYCCCV